MIDSSWQDDFDDIICNVIFSDEEFKRLMKLPAKTDLYTFIKRYFIRAGSSTEILTNESVRIIYGISYSNPTDNPYITINELSFDIYCKTDDLRNATNNIMKTRTTLVARRLYNLLTSKRYHGVYRFWIEGEQDKATSVPGYVRYNITLGFEKTY